MPRLSLSLPLLIAVALMGCAGVFAIPDGIYRIAQTAHQSKLLTHESQPQPNSPAELLPPLGQPGTQEWEVTNNNDGTVTITNNDLFAKLYLAFRDSAEPSVNTPLVLGWIEQRFDLVESPRPGYFFIQVPGGPVGGATLVVDSSLLKIYPPRLALRPKDDESQPWQFELQV